MYISFSFSPIAASQADPIHAIIEFPTLNAVSSWSVLRPGSLFRFSYFHCAWGVVPSLSSPICRIFAQWGACLVKPPTLANSWWHLRCCYCSNCCCWCWCWVAICKSQAAIGVISFAAGWWLLRRWMSTGWHWAGTGKARNWRCLRSFRCTHTDSLVFLFS